MKPLLSAAALAVFFVVSACAGTQCEQVCAAYNDCDLSQRALDLDCVEYCHNIDDLSTRSSCTSQWQAHLGCWQGQISSICDNTNTACDQSGIDWSSCIDNYCANLPAGFNEPDCSGQNYISPFTSGL